MVKVHVRDAAQQQQQQQRLDGGGECSNEGGGAERFCPSSGLQLDSKGVAVLRKKIAALLGAARANGATKLVLSVRCFAACTPHTRTALHVLPGCVSVWPSLALLRPCALVLLRPCVRLALLLCTFFSLLRYSHCNRYRHLLQHMRTVQCFTPIVGCPHARAHAQFTPPYTFTRTQALGCGAFRNPPEHVAMLFKEALLGTVVQAHS